MDLPTVQSIYHSLCKQPLRESNPQKLCSLWIGCCFCGFKDINQTEIWPLGPATAMRSLPEWALGAITQSKMWKVASVSSGHRRRDERRTCSRGSVDQAQHWAWMVHSQPPFLSQDTKCGDHKPWSFKASHGGTLPWPCPPQLLCWSLFNRTFCTSLAFPSSLHNKPCAWELTNYFWAHVLVLSRLVPPHQVSMSESHQAALGFVDGPGLWWAHTHAHTLSPVYTSPLSLSPIHTYIHTHSFSLSCTHTHTHHLSPVHTHTHTHTHSSSSPRLPASSAAQSRLGLHGRSAALTLSSELNHPN